MKKNKNSFEELMKSLEKIILDMDKNDISVEDSLKKYEEGIRLYRQCHDIIRDAELKVDIINDYTKSGGSNTDEILWNFRLK